MLQAYNKELCLFILSFILVQLFVALKYACFIWECLFQSFHVVAVWLQKKLVYLPLWPCGLVAVTP